MKKLLLLSLSALLALSMFACGSTESVAEQSVAEPEPIAADNTESELDGGEAPETVTIKTLNGEKEEIDLEVPYNPQRLAVMDLAALDILDNLGFGDRVVGVSKGSSIDYLQAYVNDDAILNLGTIKEASLETVMESEPDVIFIGGRLSSMYDELIEIAPVVYLAVDVEDGVVKATSENAMTIASLFGAEDAVSALTADFDTRVAALAAPLKAKPPS